MAMLVNQAHLGRRAFLAATVAALCSPGMAATPPAPSTRKPEAGREYLRLDPAHPTAGGNRVEVLEFFYYGCPICYEFQPFFSRFLFQTGSQINLRRIPAVSSEGWESFARLFYALGMLGEASRLHWPIYDNYHFDGIKLNDEKVMEDWVARNGVDRQKFLAAYASEEVQRNLGQSRELMKQYNIAAVPSVVIQGRYLTSARLAGGTRQLAQVIDDLVKLLLQERAKAR